MAPATFAALRATLFVRGRVNPPARDESQPHVTKLPRVWEGVAPVQTGPSGGKIATVFPAPLRALLIATKTKASAKSPPAKLPAVDLKTRRLIVSLADEVATAAEKRRDPHLDIPTRSLSNVRFNKAKKIVEMGGQKNRRQLFNLSQAKSYMQTLLVATGCKQLIEQQKTTSIRGLYYLLKHTIEGTREETFATQEECDPIIEDLEVTLESLR